MLGMLNDDILLSILFSKYGSVPSLKGETPCAVDAENVIPGVMVNCEYPATALPAGLRVIEPRSPPSAVKALPIATDRAVPS
jgi:hypothetical protein